MDNRNLRHAIRFTQRTSLGSSLLIKVIYGMILLATLMLDFGEFKHISYKKNGESKPSLITDMFQDESSSNQNTFVNNAPSKIEDLCLSQECINTAARILNNMDKNVDPCDNFYHFVCGAFLKSDTITDNQLYITSFSTITNKVYEQLRFILKEDNNAKGSRVFNLVQDLFESCMDTTTTVNQGIQPFLQILKNLGGWPVLEGNSWNKNTFDWKESIYKFRNIGISCDYFIKVYVVTDIKNNSRTLISIAQPRSLGLKRYILTHGVEDRIVQIYYKYMINVAIAFGANKMTAAVDMYYVIKFLSQLANITSPKYERQSNIELYNPLTIKELSEKYKNIPWNEYINRLLPPNVQVDENNIVNIEDPSYISNLPKLLEKTPKRVLANYVMWRVAIDSLEYLPEQFHIYNLNSVETIRKIPLWKVCIKNVITAFPMGISALYIKKYFDPDSKRNAAEMVGNIKKEFLEIVTKLDWINKRTKQSALKKISAMIPLIAYSDELLDDKKIDEYYNELEFNGDNYLKKVLNYTIFSKNKLFSKLHDPINKNEWAEHNDVTAVNAFYDLFKNSIRIPAGILQGSFFHKDRPNYVNYGTIGFVIGHEITHGFDKKGKFHDKVGNYVDWWDSDSNIIFSEKTDCLIKQYGNYIVKEINKTVDSVNTLNENIADNGGIKVAYLAYLEYVKQNGLEKFLPGLDYSGKQMFWISAANNLCSKYNHNTLKTIVATDRHSPSEFRILGSLSNMPEFSNDFNCPIGSNMNPKIKCSVW